MLQRHVPGHVVPSIDRQDGVHTTITQFQPPVGVHHGRRGDTLGQFMKFRVFQPLSHDDPKHVFRSPLVMVVDPNQPGIISSHKEKQQVPCAFHVARPAVLLLPEMQVVDTPVGEHGVQPSLS